MNTDKLIETLHSFERKVISVLEDGMTLGELSKKTGLREIEAMRALQWLENKKAIQIKKEEEMLIRIGNRGLVCTQQGLPEKRVLKLVSQGALPVGRIKSKLDLDSEEINMCIGTLKSKAAVEIKNGRLEITKQGKALLNKEWLEEKLLSKLKKENATEDGLTPEERFALESLKKRKGLVKEEKEKTRKAFLTDLGKKIKEKNISSSGFVDSLTPEMLRTGAWKKKRFRAYDIRADVPKISGGKRHFINQTIEYIKRVWLDMGFREMAGPMLDTSFWNFDALFTAQDHPVRELQDTFYVKNPAKGKLPASKVTNAVKAMHERGGDIESRGWGYKWDPEEAKKNVLRTHTTILSAKTISQLKKGDLPAKFFSVAKCFRNEALDWQHLFELYQVEGIVVDPNANFRNLIGYLRKFFEKMGYEKVRVRPAYFPYTEPSAEVEVFHPVKKEWVELAGAGIFRPEVVKPLLGEEVPVLAWGMGLERSISEFFNISDIRQLYSNDLRQLREIKMWRQ